MIEYKDKVQVLQIQNGFRRLVNKSTVGTARAGDLVLQVLVFVNGPLAGQVRQCVWRWRRQLHNMILEEEREQMVRC